MNLYEHYYVSYAYQVINTIVHRFLGDMNDVNPTLRLGEDNVNSLLAILQNIRERALSEVQLIFYVWESY